MTDPVTERVRDLYSQYPYPSPQPGRRDARELANLLRLVALETGYELQGRTVLDAGTGSGHRLVEAAVALPRTRFVGVDLSEAALAVARATADAAGVKNVELRVGNLMEPTDDWGQFDVVVSLGVVHHTPDPCQVVRHLRSNVAADGLLFLYLYGRLGAAERMRQSAIVALLLGKDRPDDFTLGIEVVRDLDLDLADYGWNVDDQDQATRDALIVDSFLHVNNVLYDIDGLLALTSDAGIRRVIPYGITVGGSGLLVDIDPAPRPGKLPVASLRQVLRTDRLKDLVAHLSRVERHRLIDLLYKPNGYTLMCVPSALPFALGDGHRILLNEVDVSGERPLSPTDV